MKVSLSQLAAHVGKSERTIERWIAKGTLHAVRGPDGLYQIEGELAEQMSSTGDKAILEALVRIERKLDILLSGETVYQQIPAPARIIREPRAQPQQERVTQESEALAALSGDVVASPLFATQHFPHEDPKKITRLLQTLRENGKVPMKLGHYKNGRGTSPYGLDEEGRRAFYLETSGRPGFHMCEQCPH